MPLLGLPSMWATKPTPQLSFSKAMSYKPICSFGLKYIFVLGDLWLCKKTTRKLLNSTLIDALEKRAIRILTLLYHIH
jgi:hypothetical protein